MHPLLLNGLAHADTSLLALEPTGHIIAIDAVGAAWLGAEPEDVIGKGTWVFGGMISEREWPATWSRLCEQRHLLAEGAIVAADGRLYQLVLRLSHVPAGPLRGPYVGVVAIRKGTADGSDDATITRLNHAAAFIDDPLSDWNPLTDELTLNPAACDALGLPPGSTLAGEQAYRYVPTEAAPQVKARIERLISGPDDRLAFVQQVELPGQPPRQMLTRLRVAARGADGRARRIVSHGVDITEHTTALALAREQQELFAAVAQTSTAAITVLDTDGRIIFANPPAEEVLGLSRSTLLERAYDDPAWRSTAPDGGPWPDENQPFIQVLTTGRPVHGVRHAIEWPDGTRRQLSINGEPVFDAEGRIHRLVFAVEDVTEQLAAAEALARSERRLREVLDRLSVGVHVVDAQGRVQFWNRTSQEMLEFGPEDAGRRRLSEETWDTVDAEGRPLPIERYPLVRALREGRAFHNEMIGVLSADEETRWFLVSAVPRIEGGAVQDVVLELSEITEQRRLEMRLREARQLEAIGRIAGGVAHDFNNLLTTIVANIEIVAETLPADDPRHADLAEVQAAIHRGTGLTRALLGYARRQFRHRRRVRVGRLLATAWRRLQPGLDGLDPVIDIDPALPPLHLDPDQFEQVLDALVANARQAMQGRGRLHIDVARYPLTADEPDWPELKAGPYVRLAVTDSGPGVDPRVVPRLFEPFISAAQLDGRAGRGLGLANCHGILRQNGGGIRLAANGPDGARFEVLWPVADGPAP